jgi:hypothetical protein
MNYTMPAPADDNAIIDRTGQPGIMGDVRLGRRLYDNPLAGPGDVDGWRLEGQAAITFPQGRLRLESVVPVSEGQRANYVFWCPEDFPDNVAISWDFFPVREPGLAMFWFAATGRNGEDLFNAHLAPRAGQYNQYHHGDIDAFHASYFRRGKPGAFALCNLRKSYGFHMVAQGADPIPSFVYDPPYRIQVVKRGREVQFSINGLVIYYFIDDGRTWGRSLGGGKIGFRQMAPLIGEYARLTVQDLLP